MKLTTLCAWSAVLYVATTPLSAQTPQDTAQSGGTLRVYLITVGQGAEVWEKFGHNALWFYDPDARIDEAYNWGVFSFDQPHFLQRFLTGDTKYWVEQVPGPLLIDYYKRSDRSIVLQRLNFTPAQALKALKYSRWNARDENKFYRYDYFRDNCSTRLRDVIDFALGGAIKAATSGSYGRETYRSESIRLVHDLKLTQLGIYTALGHPADRPLSQWQLMFIPMRMRDILRRQRIAGAPIVAEERTLYQSGAYRERVDAPRLILPYLIAGLLIALQLFAVGQLRGRSSFADKTFRIEIAIWGAVTGVLGLVLLLAWASTRHVFWYHNENLLLLGPLGLWLAALAVWRGRFARSAAIVSTVIACLSVLALLLKATPWFRQDNLALICLVMPANVAIAVGLRPLPSAADPRRAT